MTSITGFYPGTYRGTFGPTGRPDAAALERMRQNQSPQEAGGNATGKISDPRALQREKQAETAFLTQQIAQELGLGQVGAGEDEKIGYGSKAVKAFLDYMAKTPEERAFDAFLKSKGLTEEEFENLPAEEKRALLEEFEEVVRLHVEQEVNDQIAGREAIGPL